MTGEERASFVIREDEIVYPEIDAGYRYRLDNDSIVAVSGSSLGKNNAPKIVADATEYAAKSYHSSEVPDRLAAKARRSDLRSGLAVVMAHIPMSG